MNETKKLEFIREAQESLQHYKQTGLHITLEEFTTWVTGLRANPTLNILPQII